MRRLSAPHAVLRRSPVPGPWLIVVMVPLAATCMLAMPVQPGAASARTAELPSHVERGVVSPERERREGHGMRELAEPHDPPHEVAHWRASQQRPAAGLDDHRTQLACLGTPAPVGAAPNEYKTPEDYRRETGPTRGPPTWSHMG